mmetsp:Transcript_45170/g.144693  ORF Transcript_45170/g.144693 Transcript_45170/m.144693 type:complete len:333 (+) Transcript_45170:524-1522(+)
MRTSEVAHIGVAETPVSLGDFPQQLRARPACVAPEAEHAAGATLEALQVGRLQFLAVAASESDEPAPVARLEAQRDAHLAVELRGRLEADEADDLTSPQGALRLAAARGAGVRQLDGALQIWEHRPAAAPAAQHDASHQLVLVARPADEVLELHMPRATEAALSADASHGSDHQSRIGRSLQGPREVHGGDAVVAATLGLGMDEADRAGGPELGQRLGEALGRHTRQGMAGGEPVALLLGPELKRGAQQQPHPLEVVVRVEREDLLSVVLLHVRDQKHTAYPMAVACSPLEAGHRCHLNQLPFQLHGECTSCRDDAPLVDECRNLGPSQCGH